MENNDLIGIADINKAESFIQLLNRPGEFQRGLVIAEILTPKWKSEHTLGDHLANKAEFDQATSDHNLNR